MALYALLFNLVTQALQPYKQTYLIPLTKGQRAVVGAAWFWFIMAWKWRAHWSTKTKSFYAARWARRINGKRPPMIYMHRVILDAPDGVRGDHKNHNTLDNTKENLRLATHVQNMRNRGAPRNNTSGYKGVTFEKNTGKYRYRIMIDNNQRLSGSRPTALEAALEYNRLAAIYHGEFARSK